MQNTNKNNYNFVEFDPNHITGDFITPVGSTPGYTEVKGVGGKVRHAGRFSDDNYYASLLDIGANNKDIDATFERAVETEADIVKWKMEQEYARQVLLEQRAYDDPSAQISRERRAGINSDLIGGTGGSSAGGSSAQQSVPVMSDVTAQSKFKNAYDDTAEVFNGITTAVNVISSVSNFGTSIANSIVSLASLPSTISANIAKNKVVSDTAHDMIAISGDKRLKSNLDTINAGTETISRLSGILNPDSTDDDMNAFLSATGVPAESLDNYRNAIRYAHKNPQYLANYRKNVAEANYYEQYNEEYSSVVIGEMLHLGRRIKTSQMQYDLDRSQLEQKVAKLLNTEQNAENIANRQLDSNELSALGIKRDLDIYVSNLFAIQAQYSKIDAKIDAWVERVGKRSANIGKSPEDYIFTDADKLILQTYALQKNTLMTLGSDEMENLYDLLYSFEASHYLNKQNVDALGFVEPTVGLQKHQFFVGYNFPQVIRGEVSQDEVTNHLLSLIPVVGGIVADTYSKSQPKTPNLRPITINNW